MKKRTASVSDLLSCHTRFVCHRRRDARGSCIRVAGQAQDRRMPGHSPRTKTRRNPRFRCSHRPRSRGARARSSCRRSVRRCFLLQAASTGGGVLPRWGRKADAHPSPAEQGALEPAIPPRQATIRLLRRPRLWGYLVNMGLPGESRRCPPPRSRAFASPARHGHAPSRTSGAAARSSRAPGARRRCGACDFGGFGVYCSSVEVPSLCGGWSSCISSMRHRAGHSESFRAILPANGLRFMLVQGLVAHEFPGSRWRVAHRLFGHRRYLADFFSQQLASSNCRVSSSFASGLPLACNSRHSCGRSGCRMALASRYERRRPTR